MQGNIDIAHVYTQLKGIGGGDRLKGAREELTLDVPPLRDAVAGPIDLRVIHSSPLFIKPWDKYIFP